jgi:hypothetical protein
MDGMQRRYVQDGTIFMRVHQTPLQHGGGGGGSGELYHLLPDVQAQAGKPGEVLSPQSPVPSPLAVW